MRSIIVTGGFGILGRAVAQAFRANDAIGRKWISNRPKRQRGCIALYVIRERVEAEVASSTGSSGKNQLSKRAADATMPKA